MRLEGRPLVRPSRKENTMSEQPPAESQGKIVVFGARQIRRAWVDGQWYFSVVDIVGALTDSPNPRELLGRDETAGEGSPRGSVVDIL